MAQALTGREPVVIVTRCWRCGAVVDALPEHEASKGERPLVEATLWGWVAIRSHRCTDPL